MKQLAMFALACYAALAAPTWAQFDMPLPDTGSFDLPSFPRELTLPPVEAPDQMPGEGGPVPITDLPSLVNNPIDFCNLYGTADPRCPLMAPGAPPEGAPAPLGERPPADRIAILNEQPVAVSLLLISGVNVETLNLESNAVATRTFDPSDKIEARIASGSRELAFSLVTGVDYSIRPYNGAYFVVPVR